MPEPKPPKQTVITFENTAAGWISSHAAISLPVAGSPSTYRYQFGMTSMRPGKEGHIGPAEIMNANPTLFTNIAANANSLPRAVATCSDKTAIAAQNAKNSTSFVAPFTAILQGGLAGVAPRITIVDAAGNAVRNYDISGGGGFATLPVTGFFGEDIIYYPAVSSIPSPAQPSDAFFYSWCDENNVGYIGRYDIATDAFDDVWNTNVPTGQAALAGGTCPIRLCVGPDFKLYFTQGEWIGSYDGVQARNPLDNDGLLIPQALDCGVGWMTTDIVSYGQVGIAIAASQIGTSYSLPTYECESRVDLWNGSDLLPSAVYDLTDWFISSLFYYEGMLYAFTQGNSGTMKLKVLMPYQVAFQTQWEALLSVVGNAPRPNQVDYFNDQICWAGDSTTFMVYGLTRTQTGFSMNPLYMEVDGNVLHPTETIGLLKNLTSNLLCVGIQAGSVGYELIGAYGDGLSNGNMVASLIPSGISQEYLDHRTPVVETGYRFSVVKLKGYFSSFGASSSMLLSLIPNFTPINGSGDPISGIDKLNWTVNVANHPNIATTLTASTAEAATTPSLITDISNFWMNFRNVTPSSSTTPPILRKVEVIIEETTKP